MQPLKVQIYPRKTLLVAMFLVPLAIACLAFGGELWTGSSPARALAKFAAITGILGVICWPLMLGVLLSGQLHGIIADEAGLQLQAGRKSRRIAWSQIATVERSQAAQAGELRPCLTLRDAGGLVQATLFRQTQELPHTRAQWDALEALIESRIGKRGVISAPLEGAPLQSAFATQNQNKIIGWGCLLLFVPATALSWNHPTGGPATGAVFGVFSVLGLYLALNGVRYQVDERGARSQSLWKQRELRWDQVHHAELLRGALHIRLIGEEAGEKIGVEIPGPAGWGQSGAELMLFLQFQFKRCGIAWESDKTRQGQDISSRPKKR